MSLLHSLGKSWEFSLPFVMYIPLCVLIHPIKHTASVCNVSTDFDSAFSCIQANCCPGIETLPWKHRFAYLTVEPGEFCEKGNG